MRDWRGWHEDYRDPASDLSQRLAVVQASIRDWLDAQPPRPLRLLSLCAGQGHDVVGALREHPRRDDVSGALVELDPWNVATANGSLRDAGLTTLRAVEADAGTTSSLASAVPADLVLVCGVFGNITDEDVRRTIDALPMLCAAEATVVWTRHRGHPDLTPSIGSWFSAGGFEEVSFTSPGPGSYAVGVHRLSGKPTELRPDVRMFRFTA